MGKLFVLSRYKNVPYLSRIYSQINQLDVLFNRSTSLTWTDDSNYLIDHIDISDSVILPPGTPYPKSINIYTTLKYLREKDINTFGICSGFQYMIIELLKNILKLDASSEEFNDNSNYLIISKLKTSLNGKKEQVTDLCNNKIMEENYLCSYGVNPIHVDYLNKIKNFKTTYINEEKQIRGFKMTNMKYYEGVLFVPELNMDYNIHPKFIEFYKEIHHIV